MRASPSSGPTPMLGRAVKGESVPASLLEASKLAMALEMMERPLARRREASKHLYKDM